MSLEFWTAFGSVGTLVVIAVTAFIALIQVRHMRAANQALFLNNLFIEYEGPEFRHAFNFVRADLGRRLEDPDFRRELRSGVVDRANHPEITVLNFFEQLGHLYGNGAIDQRIFMQAFSGVVISFWERLEPVVALTADPLKGNMSFQLFEFLKIEARTWVRRHPYGEFPKGRQRIPLLDPWRDIDASQTPRTVER
jgi:hypothetical protein